jgi:hypothetical protein
VSQKRYWYFNGFLGRQLLLVFFVILSTTDSLAASEEAVKVGENVQVSAANSHLIHLQPVVDVDPDDPQHLIACSHLLTEEPEKTFHGVVYVSFDGGKTWLESLRPEGEGLHPACAFGRGRLAYVVTLGRSDCLPGMCTYNNLEIYRSTDGGRKWSKSSGFFHADDHPYISVDRVRQTRRDVIYVSTLVGAMPFDDLTANANWPALVPSGFAVYISDDEGKSFSAPVSAYSSGGHGVPILGSSCIMADGTYVLMFPELMKASSEFDDHEKANHNAWIKVVTSHNGGKTLEHASVVAATNWGLDRGTSSSLQQGIAADVSSSPFRNRLYVVWQARQLTRHRIWLSHSDDVGKTWSTPVSIDDAPPEASGGPNDFMPAVAVNNVGVVGITWYDRRENPDGLGWYARFAASLDGGDTFLPSVRVSTAPMSFSHRHQATYTGRFSDTVSDEPSSAVDYSTGFAAGPDGVFRAAWTDNRTGYPQLWTAPIKVSGPVFRNGSNEASQLSEVSSSAPVHIGNPYWDWSTGEFECDLFIKNVSPTMLPGPLKLRFLSFDSALGVVSAVKVDGRPIEAGSIVAIAQDGLKPAAWSKPIRLTAQVKVLFGPHDPDAGGRLRQIFRIDSKTLAPFRTNNSVQN